MFKENQHLRKTIVDLAAQGGLYGYAPPSRYRMRGELLDYHYETLQPLVRQTLMSTTASCSRLWVSLTFDGWDNTSKTHLLGVMCVSRVGGCFVETIDTTGVDLLGKEWTLEQIRTCVDKLGGAERVAAVVLDSPSTNRAALKAYEKEEPTIACLYCTCHVISLFIKDVFNKVQTASENWETVNQISKKFRGVKWLREQVEGVQKKAPLVHELSFRSGPLTYKAHCVTRMASKYFQIERANILNVAAKAVVDLPAYQRKYESVNVAARVENDGDQGEGESDIEGEAGTSLSDQLEANKEAIHNKDVWNDARNVLSVLKPAMLLLKQADSDAIMVGKLYSKLNAVHTQLEEDCKRLGGDWGEIPSLFYSRWEYFHHPIISLAHVLHPDHNESNPMADDFVRADVDEMLKRHFKEASDRAAVLVGIERYLARQQHFSLNDETGTIRSFWVAGYITETSPWDWWRRFIEVEPLLAPLAIKVLQVSITSSPCERHFSKWAFIVSKYRTRLSLRRQHKLTYLYSNWRALESYDEDKWYRSDSDDDE